MTGETIRSKSGFGFTIHDDRDGSVSLMLSTGHSMSVNGFDPAELRDALDKVAPPIDYADGGVSAAAIEAEVVSPERARSLVQERNDALARAEQAGENVRAREEMVNRLAARAEKAERAAKTLGKVVEDQCRDIARITRSEHMVSEDGDADWGAIWERGFSMADSLREANATVKSLRTENPRPLTADDVDRALDAAVTSWRTSYPPEDQPYETWKIKQAAWSALRALGLIATPPPSRPEGAEEIRTLLSEALGSLMSSKELTATADFLAERGVRVTGVPND